jgi:ACS family sodium-dependent inorganic phosphate cotransporter
VLWTILWWLVAADSPETDKHISTEERHFILKSLPPSYDATTPVPWRPIFSSQAVWAIVAGHTAHNWLFYTLLTYLPDYLTYELNFNIKEAGFIAVLPYIGCFLGSILAGRGADYVIQRFGLSIVTTRRLFQAGFEVSAGVVLVIAGYTSSVPLAVACVTMSVAFVGAGAAGGYAPNILDLSAYFGGLLMGISNTVATIPGIVSPIITGLVVTSDTKSATTIDEWRFVFWLGLCVAVVGNGIFVVFAGGQHLPGLQAPSDELLDEDDGALAEDGSSGSTAPLVSQAIN